MTPKEQIQYEEAIKRVKKIKGFYTHLAVYVLVNGFLILKHCFKSNFEILLEPHTYSLCFYWGIGLLAHWFSVFGRNMIFGNNWEEKKIKELMEKEKENEQKWQ
jgi:hypothetical protein